jgi:hypothetical protein
LDITKTDLHYAIDREQDYCFLWPPDQKCFFSSKANRHSGPPNIKMNYSTVEDVLASFPHPILPTVEGETDYQTIHATRKFLQANSRSIDTHLGGGTLGHWGLIIYPLTVHLPNGATMESYHTADLDIPEVNAAASKAHVLPGMANHSLLSVGQLCDEGYIVTFKRDTVTICNSKNSKILSGPRDETTGLWRINLKQTSKHIPDPIAINVYELCSTVALVHYLHKALFSPMKAAILQAVKDGHLITWPGLTEDIINKHLKLTPATAMGHMNQRRQNIRSTSKATTEKQQPPDIDLGTKTHLVYAVVVDQGQLYTDLTGKFPVRSRKGNYYVMVCYIYDCNYIKVVPMKSRSASEWVKAYDSIHQEITVKGFKPKLQTLDNEASAALKNFFTVNSIAYQLVPPHCH